MDLVAKTLLAAVLLSTTVARAEPVGGIATADRFADRPFAAAVLAGLTATGPFGLEAGAGLGRYVVVAGQVGPGYGSGETASVAGKVRLQAVGERAAVGIAIGPSWLVAGSSAPGEAERRELMTAVEVGVDVRNANGWSFRAFSGFLKQTSGSGDGVPIGGVGVGYAR